ncbi:17043_t:CDS:2, partial [Entrophospora sp. SA101]
ETVIRKIRAWRQLLNASGSEDTAADLETLDLFTETDLNLQPELDSDLDVKIFWKCFEDAMSSNIKGHSISSGEDIVISNESLA